MHISGCLDNENGAPVPYSFVAGDAVSNSGMSSAIKNGTWAGNSCFRSHLE